MNSHLFFKNRKSPALSIRQSGSFSLRVLFPPRWMAAFTMVELLAVMAVMAILTTASGPALQALMSSSGVSGAIVGASSTLDYARSYAMSHHTYVRVAIGQTATSGVYSSPSTVLIAISSVDGTLDSDAASSMTDASKWRLFIKPVILENFTISKSLTVDMAIDSSNYASPNQTDIPSVKFKAGSYGVVTCNSFIQFNPNGEARVVRGDAVRFIDLALDKPAPQSGRNPFVLRVAGLSGNINILRKGEGIQ